MATGVAIFTVGSSVTTFARPTNSAAATTYFGLAIAMDPPNERLTRWTANGVNGQFIKKHGSAARKVTLTGFVEGSTLANRATAMAAMEALTQNQAEGTLKLWDESITYTTVIPTNLKWSRFANNAGRYAAYFTIDFEVTGS